VPTLSSATCDDPAVRALTAAQQVELRARHDGAEEYEPAPPFEPYADDEDSLHVARALA
jgi:hypothetical protein